MNSEGGKTTLVDRLRTRAAAFTALAGGILALLILVPQYEDAIKKIYCGFVTCDRRVAQGVSRETKDRIDETRNRALEYLEDGNSDKALAEIDNLQKDIDLIGTNAPSDQTLRGLTYKTIAQVYEVRGNQDEKKRNIELALNSFAAVIKSKDATTSDLASAYKGIGNSFALMGEHNSALFYIKLAADIDPDAYFVWHDVFLAYMQSGRTDAESIDAAEEALSRAKKELPLLSKTKIDQLERLFAQYKARIAAGQR